MGYIRHHAIVVTGNRWEHDRSLPSIDQARSAAVDCGCQQVSEEVGPAINGTLSFLVAPDGSKEEWTDSDLGDRARDAFVRWLREDGRRGYFAWAEVVLCPDD